MFPPGVEELAHNPLSVDKSVFLCLPGKRVIGSWGVSVLQSCPVLKKLPPGAPVLPSLDDI